MTINRFRNRVKNEINNIFTQVVLLLAKRGFITLDVEYIDGTKIESKANKYTFVWRKTVEKNRAKLQEKIRILLAQIEDVIAQDKAAEAERVEFTPATLDSFIGDLDALAAEPQPADKEQKKQQREKKKQIKELEKHRDKLGEYDSRLEWITFLVALSLSMFLMTKASEKIPIGTVYPVWTDIGAVGAVMVGIFFFNEPATF